MNTEIMAENKPKKIFNRKNIWGKLSVLTTILPLVVIGVIQFFDIMFGFIRGRDSILMLLIIPFSTPYAYIIGFVPTYGVYAGMASCILAIISLVNKESKGWSYIALFLSMTNICLAAYAMLHN